MPGQALSGSADEEVAERLIGLDPPLANNFIRNPEQKEFSSDEKIDLVSLKKYGFHWWIEPYTPRPRGMRSKASD